MVVVRGAGHALKRGAKIYAEIVGQRPSDWLYDMGSLSGEGAIRYMQQALATVDAPIDYLNTTAPSPRSATSPRSEACAKCSVTSAGHQLDEEPVRPLAGRRRRARGTSIAC